MQYAFRWMGSPLVLILLFGVSLARAECDPQGKDESWSQYQSRVDESKNAGVAIKPQAANESWSEYQSRVEASKNSKVAIAPRGENESAADYQARIDAAKKKENR